MNANEDAQIHVGVRELRSKLASYLRAANDGSRIVVTQGGTAIAELVPVGGLAGGADGAQGLVSLGALAGAGLLEPPQQPQRFASGQAKSDATESNAAESDAAPGEAEPSTAPIALPVGVSCTAALAEVRGTRARRLGRS